jgi:hypothetical protein
MAFEGAFYYADPGGTVVDVTQAFKVGKGIQCRGIELICLITLFESYTCATWMDSSLLWP